MDDHDAPDGGSGDEPLAYGEWDEQRRIPESYIFGDARDGEWAYTEVRLSRGFQLGVFQIRPANY